MKEVSIQLGANLDEDLNISRVTKNRESFYDTKNEPSACDLP